MPPHTSATLPVDAAVVQSAPITSSSYNAERLAIIKLMAVMTALAVALIVVVTTWFTELNAISGMMDDFWAHARAKVIGGGIGIGVLAIAMVSTWVKLVKRLARVDWVGIPAARALRVGMPAAFIRPDTTCHLCHASCALCWAVRHGRNVSMKQCCCKPFHCAQHHD